jgi:hypothetical protein
MVTAIIKAVPPDEFEEISILIPDWRRKFLSLVQREKRIKYHRLAMPSIPADIRTELRTKNYFDLILEQDRNQHFLIPRTD